MNLYCGNLSYECTDEDLRKAFDEYGQIELARVITDRFTGRSRGFGFVEMPNDDEANSAINALNGKEFMGRELRVSEAKPREERPRRGSQSGGRGEW
jgi:RNA recognition motif-containing protein